MANKMKVLRVILMILNLLLAVGLVLTTLAGTVPPSRCILFSLLSFAYLPLLLANVVMVLVWALMKRWQFVISVAAVALRWSYVGLFLQLGGTSQVPASEEHPRMVTVMSYNVHQFRGNADGEKSLDTVAQGFLDLIDNHRPDVLCLQEFAVPKEVKVVDSLLLRGYNHYYSSRTTKAGLPYGTTVFSRIPITYVKRIDNKKVLVELMHDSGSFRLCCLHMASYRFDDADWQEIKKAKHGEVQASSLRTLDKVKRTLHDHEEEWEERLRPVVDDSSLPMLVAGDMNDIPSSWLYRQLSKRLKDTFQEKGSGLCTTYNGGFPQFRIDMVFHSEGFRTLSYRRLRVPLSDHYPVLAALELDP